MLNSGQGLCTLLPVNSETKFSVILGLGLSQYRANKRTPFPTATTEECNETCRRKVKVNIFTEKKSLHDTGTLPATFSYSGNTSNNSDMKFKF